MATDAPDPAFALMVDTLYGDLRTLARSVRRRNSAVHAESLVTTALVHEAWLKLARRPEFRDQSHFLATAALAMRHVLVSRARARLAEKRGAAQTPVSLEAHDFADDPAINQRVVSIDNALAGLEATEPRAARVVECRYFAGMTEAETALALGITERTVQRDWVKAKALLYDALASD
jgi:RNA polymerase sigma factor (TIGR02999 family)